MRNNNNNPLGYWDSYISLDEEQQGDRGAAARARARSSATATDYRPPATAATTTTTVKSYRQRHHRYYFWNAFWEMTIPYFYENSIGRNRFFMLVVLMVGNSCVLVYFSFLSRDFWSALGDKDIQQFYNIMKQFFLALLCLAPINVLYRFQQQRLGIHWREWMTTRILHLYYNNQVYYNLEQTQQRRNIVTTTTSSTTGSYDYDQSNSSNSSSGGITTAAAVDNPDQRIAEDIKNFTNYSLNLFLTVAVSFIDLICFSIILYSIEPMLFVCIIGFVFFGTICTYLIGKKLINLNFIMLQKEADLRYSLVQTRDNAESIAFFRGEDKERQYVNTRLRDVITNAKYIIGTQRNLDFFTTLYNYLTWVLPIIVIAPEYFNGNVDLGVVQQSASAFSHVLDDLSLIINQFDTLTEFTASIDRLYQFLFTIQQLVVINNGGGTAAPTTKDNVLQKHSKLRGWNAVKEVEEEEVDGIMRTNTQHKVAGAAAVATTITRQTTKTGTIQMREVETMINDHDDNNAMMALRINKLCLVTPDYSQILIDSMSIELPWNRSLLIYGPSGVGKSSLLRAIAGLWTTGSGSIDRPTIDEIYFLPQRPYCPTGTLRDQLLYPMNTTTTSSNTDDREGRRQQQQEQGDDDYFNGEGVSSYDNNTTMSHIVDNNELLGILNSIDLIDLATRLGDGNPIQGLDCVIDWSNTLSLGEQQRLGFGRILVNKPRLVILDESTSAMDVSSEGKMYRLLKERMPKPFTYISVGHRPTLLNFHDLKLKLTKLRFDGANNNHCYNLEPISSTQEEGVSSAEMNLFFGG